MLHEEFETPEWALTFDQCLLSSHAIFSSAQSTFNTKLKLDDNFQGQLLVYFPGDTLRHKFLMSAGTGEGDCCVVDIVQQGGGGFALLHGEQTRLAATARLLRLREGRGEEEWGGGGDSKG